MFDAKTIDTLNMVLTPLMPAIIIVTKVVLLSFVIVVLAFLVKIDF